MASVPMRDITDPIELVGLFLVESLSRDEKPKVPFDDFHERMKEDDDFHTAKSWPMINGCRVETPGKKRFTCMYLEYDDDPASVGLLERYCVHTSRLLGRLVKDKIVFVDGAEVNINDCLWLQGAVRRKDVDV